VAALLARLAIAEPDAARLARAGALTLLRPGAAVRAEAADGGELLGIEFLGSRDMRVRIRRDGPAFRASQDRAPIESHVAMRSGVIRSSLFAASDEAGIPDAVAMQLAEIFGGDVDFHRDLRSRDRFSVVYEMQYLDGLPLRAGRVLAAEFVNQRKVHRAIWFSGGYYDPAGRNLRKAFLRSPLEFSRVSSGFGMRRHPFLQSWRAHRGVDYVAPAGTRVRAVADGVVEFAGRNGGYGNVVVLRHGGRTTTLYAHLRGIARGVRPGTRIGQGETIGFVGQSGWATGPHLHYEFRIAGEARNPLAMALPAAQPVAAHELEAFRRQAEPLVARLDLLADAPVALLE
jgi:murein DD-endopeptidase MepM/ murein hydrolase activator NlpD